MESEELWRTRQRTAETRRDLRRNHGSSLRKHEPESRGVTSHGRKARAQVARSRPESAGRWFRAPETAQSRECGSHVPREASICPSSRAGDELNGLPRVDVPANEFQRGRNALSARPLAIASRRITTHGLKHPRTGGIELLRPAWTTSGTPPRVRVRASYVVRVHVPASRARPSGLDPPLRESLTLLPRGWGYGSAYGITTNAESRADLQRKHFS